MKRETSRFIHWLMVVATAGVVTLWIRSQYTADVLNVNMAPIRFWATTAKGVVYLGDRNRFLSNVPGLRYDQVDAEIWQSDAWGNLYGSRTSYYRFLGFRYAKIQRAEHWVLGIPMWFVVALLLLMPARRAWRFWRDRWRVACGVCVNCGYDLRGRELGVQGGWEISFGDTGQRNQFLIELIRAVPDGVVMDIKDTIDADDAESLKPHVRYWTPSSWLRSAVLGVEIITESRPMLEAVIQRTDLLRQWCHIKVFKGDKVYFDSHDFMQDSFPFVTDAISPDRVKAWKDAGVIVEYDRFDPELP